MAESPCRSWEPVYTGTRVWGAIYYPLLKFLVRTTLEPRGESEPVSVSAILLMAILVPSIVLPFWMLLS